MVGFTWRHAAFTALALVLAGCGGGPQGPYRDYVGSRSDDSPLQCVPYAREQSGIRIYGDAYTWWDKAEGNYERSYTPQEGAVMVLYNYAGPRHGHVAVVKRVVSTRVILVDHANWLNDGAIYEDDPVRDVSPDNDWSQVRVYNIQAQHWGGRIYPVQGFILPDEPSRQGSDALVAQIQRMLDEDDLDADD